MCVSKQKSFVALILALMTEAWGNSEMAFSEKSVVVVVCRIELWECFVGCYCVLQLVISRFRGKVGQT